MTEISDVFVLWMERWKLTPDGVGFRGQSGSHLLPVKSAGKPAILRIASREESRFGADIMAWYDGDGAAMIMAREESVVLLERVVGDRDLASMACEGQDDEATRIICNVIGRLHCRRAAPPPALMPLSNLFRALQPTALRHGGLFAKAAAAAAALFAAPGEIIPLHGDVHHRNILDGRERGWLAIDARGVLGERGFDYANLFNNPDVDVAHNPALQIATAQGALDRRIKIVARMSGIESRRLLQWILAYSGLSAAWTVGSGGDATVALVIAEIAAQALNT